MGINAWAKIGRLSRMIESREPYWPKLGNPGVVRPAPVIPAPTALIYFFQNKISPRSAREYLKPARVESDKPDGRDSRFPPLADTLNFAAIWPMARQQRKLMLPSPPSPPHSRFAGRSSYGRSAPGALLSHVAYEVASVSCPSFSSPLSSIPI